MTVNICVRLGARRTTRSATVDDGNVYRFVLECLSVTTKSAVDGALSRYESATYESSRHQNRSASSEGT